MRRSGMLLVPLTAPARTSGSRSSRYAKDAHGTGRPAGGVATRVAGDGGTT